MKKLTYLFIYFCLVLNFPALAQQATQNYAQEADKAFTTKKYAAAIDLYQKAIHNAPQDAALYLSLAKAQTAILQHKEAYFSALKSLDLGNGLALLYLVEQLPNLPAGITAEVTEPTKQYYIHDLASVLTNEERILLNDTLRTFQTRKGIQFGVIILPTLPAQTIENLAEQIAKVWNLHYQSKKGILLLIAIKEHKMRLHVLADLRKDISDAQAVNLLDTYLKPASKQNQYAKGLLALLNNMPFVGQASKGVNVENQKTNTEEQYIFMYISFIFCMGMMLSLSSNSVPSTYYMTFLIMWAAICHIVDSSYVRIPYFWLVSTSGFVTLTYLMYRQASDVLFADTAMKDYNQAIEKLKDLDKKYNPEQVMKHLNAFKDSLVGKFKSGAAIKRCTKKIIAVTKNPDKYLNKRIDAELVDLQTRWAEIKDNFTKGHQTWIAGKLQEAQNTLSNFDASNITPEILKQSAQILDSIRPALAYKYSTYIEAIKIIKNETSEGLWHTLTTYYAPEKDIKDFKTAILQQAESPEILQTEESITIFYEQLKAIKTNPKTKFAIRYESEILQYTDHYFVTRALHHLEYNPIKQKEIRALLETETKYFIALNGQQLTEADKIRLNEAVQIAKTLCDNPIAVLGWNYAYLKDKCDAILEESFWKKYKEIFVTETIEKTKQAFQTSYQKIADQPENTLAYQNKLLNFYQQKLQIIGTKPTQFMELKPVPKSKKNPTGSSQFNADIATYYDTEISYDDYSDYSDTATYSDTSSYSDSTYSDSSSSYSDSSSSYSDSSSSYSDSSGGGSSDW